MALLQSISTLPVQSVRPTRLARRSVVVSAKGGGGRSAPIYIGDVPGKGYSVKGYKGRIIQDDPAKYPSKDELGLVGGWALGEVGLKNSWIRSDIKSGSIVEVSKFPYGGVTGKVTKVNDNGTADVSLDVEPGQKGGIFFSLKDKATFEMVYLELAK